jgi:hypothetical protein
MATGWCVDGCRGETEYSDRVFRDHTRYLTGGSHSLVVDVILALFPSAFAGAAELGLIKPEQTSQNCCSSAQPATSRLGERTLNSTENRTGEC